MLSDPFPDARMNAVTGLARMGDQRSIPYLLEMLEAENRFIAEPEAVEQEKQWKREAVWTVAMRAIESMIANQELDYRDEILEALADFEQRSDGQTKMHARELLARLRDKHGR